MEVDIDAAGEQLRIYQDQYKETSKEYDQLFKELNQTSQVQHTSVEKVFCYKENL